MRQDNARDLLPWILGVALLGAGAFGVALLMASPAPKSAESTAAVSEMHSPPPLAVLPAPLQTSPYPPAAVPFVAAPPGTAPMLAANPIWECEVNGHKVFADSPCGAGASLRTLHETNRMMPTPIVANSAVASVDPLYGEPYPDDLQSTPGNMVYAVRPAYWHRLSPPIARGHHPPPHTVRGAHGM